MFDERWFDSCGICGWKPPRSTELRNMTIRVKPGHRACPPWESPSRGIVSVQAWQQGEEEPVPHVLRVCEECARAAAESWGAIRHAGGR